MDFKVSVIIPAFNVEDFIEKSILSALVQDEVNEVIVVDDGSTDNTLKIIEALIKTSSKLKVFQHEGKINRGRSSSRNLGLQKAKSKFIAFLDADDFYLEKRFEKDKYIFTSKSEIDVVYNAVGFHFYRKISDKEINGFKLNTLNRKVPSTEIFDALIDSKYGYLHLNGITVKKSVLEKLGGFNESLKVAEDSELIFKMALKAQMVPGTIKVALALRGVHGNNIFDKEDIYKKYNIKLYESLILWAGQNNVSLKNIDTLLNWLWFFKFKEKQTILQLTMYWLNLFIKNPKLFITNLWVKYFPIIRLRQKLFPFLFK